MVPMLQKFIVLITIMNISHINSLCESCLPTIFWKLIRLRLVIRIWQ